MSALPPGIVVREALGEAEAPVVCCDLSATDAKGQRVAASVVCTPAEARAWGAELIRHADLAERAEWGCRPVLRVLP